MPRKMRAMTLKQGLQTLLRECLMQAPPGKGVCLRTTLIPVPCATVSTQNPEPFPHG